MLMMTMARSTNTTMADVWERRMVGGVAASTERTRTK